MVKSGDTLAEPTIYLCESTLRVLQAELWPRDKMVTSADLLKVAGTPQWAAAMGLALMPFTQEEYDRVVLLVDHPEDLAKADLAAHLARETADEKASEGHGEMKSGAQPATPSGKKHLAVSSTTTTSRWPPSPGALRGEQASPPRTLQELAQRRVQSPGGEGASPSKVPAEPVVPSTRTIADTNKLNALRATAEALLAQLRDDFPETSALICPHGPAALDRASSFLVVDISESIRQMMVILQLFRVAAANEVISGRPQGRPLVQALSENTIDATFAALLRERDAMSELGVLERVYGIVPVPALVAIAVQPFFVPGESTSANQLLATARALRFVQLGRLNLSVPYDQLATALGKVKHTRAVADWDAVSRALVTGLSEAATLNTTIYDDLGQDAQWQPWLINLLKRAANRTREDRYSRKNLEDIVLKLAHFDKCHTGTSAWADAAKEPGADHAGVDAVDVFWTRSGTPCPGGCQIHGRPHTLPPGAAFCRLCAANVPAWICSECKMATPIAFGPRCANGDRGGCPGEQSDAEPASDEELSRLREHFKRVAAARRQHAVRSGQHTELIPYQRAGQPGTGRSGGGGGRYANPTVGVAALGDGGDLTEEPNLSHCQGWGGGGGGSRAVEPHFSYYNGWGAAPGPGN